MALRRFLLSPVKLAQLPHEALSEAMFCAAASSKETSASHSKDKSDSHCKEKEATPSKEKQDSSSKGKQASPPKPKETSPKPKTLMIYRYNPETPQNKPHMQKFEIDMNKCGGMVLDALTLIKAEIDPTLSFRRSCREAICGCCAVNIRGVNSLACITPLAGKEKILRIYPLPHMYVLRDLVTDQTHFFAQYARVQPWLQRHGPASDTSGCDGGGDGGSRPKSLLQSERDRAKLDGLYECILCGCCSASCPAYWWHYDKFLGPAVLMQAYRWVIDSRDQNTAKRLRNLSDYFSVYRCHTIMNCTNCCPKNLNPGRAIAELKRMLIGHVKKQCPDM